MHPVAASFPGRTTARRRPAEHLGEDRARCAPIILNVRHCERPPPNGLNSDWDRRTVRAPIAVVRPCDVRRRASRPFCGLALAAVGDGVPIVPQHRFHKIKAGENASVLSDLIQFFALTDDPQRKPVRDRKTDPVHYPAANGTESTRPPRRVLRIRRRNSSTILDRLNRRSSAQTGWSVLHLRREFSITNRS